MKTNPQLISEWISEQIELGKTDDELNNRVFYDGSDVYTIKKSNRKGIFDLRCTIGGAISLKDLRDVHQ
ncbi:hypothetical protein [Paenibacillus medicaginis]|uniref:Uncharacterized protein n=1 Tax=Paenibacillus medicaginis TaxID=1470560 RepID=A0ABV5BUV0_9BACL